MFAKRLVCSWIGALGLAAGAFSQTYVRFSVDNATIPKSINEKGEIAGYYSDFAGHNHGFVRDLGGTITTFDVPGSFETFAVSINDEGAITGYYNITTPPPGMFAPPTDLFAVPRETSLHSMCPEALERSGLNAVTLSANPSLTGVSNREVA